MLYNQFHDIICGSLIDEAYEDSLGKYEMARRKVRKVIDSSLDEFREAGAAIHNLINLLVFNPLAKRRKDIASARLSFSQDGIEEIKVTDGKGKEIPVSDSGTEVRPAW